MQSDMLCYTIENGSAIDRAWGACEGTFMTKTPNSDDLKQKIKELEEERAVWRSTEKELREKERRYHAIFDHAYQFIGLMSPDGTLLQANKTALAFSGVAESDVLDKPFWDTPWWSHSRELQARLREAVKAAAEGGFVRFEATHIAAGGAVRYVDFSLTPVKDEAGNVVLLIPEGRDITDRKLAEQALSQSENTFRALLNAPTDSFLLIDRRGAILAANRVAAASLRRSVDQVVGKKFADLISARVAQSRMTRVRQVAESKRPVRFEDMNKGGDTTTTCIPSLMLKARSPRSPSTFETSRTTSRQWPVFRNAPRN